MTAMLILVLNAAAQQPGHTATTVPSAVKNPAGRFNIEFDGGKPELLVRIISTAAGFEPNTVIHPDAQDVEIPPFNLRDVTAGQVFSTVNVLLSPSGEAQWTQVKVPSPGGRRGPFGGEEQQDAEIWTLLSARTRPNSETPAKVCRVYNLQPVLEKYTIEDINSLINGAWDLINGPVPQIFNQQQNKQFLKRLKHTSDQRGSMKFHQETKLLIVRGPVDQIEAVDQVIAQLNSTMTGNSTGSRKAPRQPAPGGGEARPNP